jgi:hypothetical protein
MAVTQKLAPSVRGDIGWWAIVVQTPQCPPSRVPIQDNSGLPKDRAASGQDGGNRTRKLARMMDGDVTVASVPDTARLLIGLTSEPCRSLVGHPPSSSPPHHSRMRRAHRAFSHCR